eukprot:TRINITY_DN21579_c0_g1_i1.p1 TRINITY_DN21579_c0_g1~~TRINITY_DN21579_c0_g1_i1.p1  ORF type:complete len:364 (+),score=53.15 TRINITY_DN21579_c0_g1_i1:100-1191(+)
MSTSQTYQQPTHHTPLNKYGIRRSREERHILHRWKERETITGVLRWVAIAAFASCWVASCVMIQAERDLIKLLTENPQYRHVYEGYVKSPSIDPGTALYYTSDNQLSSDVTPLQSVEVVASASANYIEALVESTPLTSVTILKGADRQISFLVIHSDSGKALLLRDTEYSYQQQDLHLPTSTSILYSETDPHVVFFPEANLKLNFPFWNTPLVYASNQEILLTRMRQLDGVPEIDTHINQKQLTITMMGEEVGRYTIPEDIISKASITVGHESVEVHGLTTSFQLVRMVVTSSRFAGISISNSNDGTVSVLPPTGCVGLPMVVPNRNLFVHGIGAASPTHSPPAVFHNPNAVVRTLPGMVCAL